MQDELRVRQAQLIGWLEGIFQGVNVALLLQRAMAGRDAIRALAIPSRDGVGHP